MKETKTEKAKPERYLTSYFPLKSSYSNIFGEVAINFKSNIQSTQFHIIMAKNQFHWFGAGCWAGRAPDPHVRGSVGAVQESPITCRCFQGYSSTVKMSPCLHCDLAPHSLNHLGCKDHLSPAPAKGRYNRWCFLHHLISGLFEVSSVLTQSQD